MVVFGGAKSFAPPIPFQNMSGVCFFALSGESRKIALENAVFNADEQILAQSEQLHERGGMAISLIARFVGGRQLLPLIRRRINREH